jgi:hypothetical protein
MSQNIIQSISLSFAVFLIAASYLFIVCAFCPHLWKYELLLQEIEEHLETVFLDGNREKMRKFLYKLDNATFKMLKDNLLQSKAGTSDSLEKISTDLASNENELNLLNCQIAGPALQVAASFAARPAALEIQAEEFDKFCQLLALPLTCGAFFLAETHLHSFCNVIANKLTEYIKKKYKNDQELNGTLTDLLKKRKAGNKATQTLSDIFSPSSFPILFSQVMSTVTEVLAETRPSSSTVNVEAKNLNILSFWNDLEQLLLSHFASFQLEESREAVAEEVSQKETEESFESAVYQSNSLLKDQIFQIVEKVMAILLPFARIFAQTVGKEWQENRNRKEFLKLKSEKENRKHVGQTNGKHVPTQEYIDALLELMKKTR